MNPKDWNEGLNHLDPDIVEEYTAQKDAYTRQKSKKPYWFASVAAALVVAIGLGILAGGEGTPSETIAQTDGPNHSAPSNIRFDSIIKIQELFAAAAKGQTELTCFLEANIAYYGTEFSTQADIKEFRTFLDTVLLPCRESYENNSFSLYYYPGYGLEYFCDVDGIRYCFFVRPYAAWNPDGDEATIVTLDGVSAELREGSYGDSRRLFATFYIGEQVVSMWANTTDPNEVNLSGFYWGNLVPSSDLSN